MRPSSAASLTYHMDLAVGPGTITGFITTNGDIGVLSTGDIIDWDLTLFDGAASLTIQPGTTAVSGSSLTATSTGLFFDFSGVSGAFFGFPTHPYLCFEDATGACSLHPSTISMNVPGGIGAIWADFSGNVEIASAVPIPAALPLFASGLVGLGLLGWRRKRKALSSQRDRVLRGALRWPRAGPTRRDQAAASTARLTDCGNAIGRKKVFGYR